MAKEAKTEVQVPTLAPAPAFTRKLFNRGHRRIDLPANGRKIATKDFSFHPQKGEAFTEDEAARLLKAFKGELIDMDNVSVENLSSQGLQARIADQSRAEEEAIARRLEEARLLKKQKAFEAALAEGFTEQEARDIAGLPAPKDDGDKKE